MTPLHELLSRIRWDADFGAAQFELGYYDRVGDRVVRVDLCDLSFDPANRSILDLVDDEGRHRSIPLHRVKEVWRNGCSIWRREYPGSA